MAPPNKTLTKILTGGLAKGERDLLRNCDRHLNEYSIKDKGGEYLDAIYKLIEYKLRLFSDACISTERKLEELSNEGKDAPHGVLSYNRKRFVEWSIAYLNFTEFCRTSLMIRMAHEEFATTLAYLTMYNYHFIEKSYAALKLEAQYRKEYLIAPYREFYFNLEPNTLEHSITAYRKRIIQEALSNTIKMKAGLEVAKKYVEVGEAALGATGITIGALKTSKEAPKQLAQKLKTVDEVCDKEIDKIWFARAFRWKTHTERQKWLDIYWGSGGLEKANEGIKKIAEINKKRLTKKANVVNNMASAIGFTEATETFFNSAPGSIKDIWRNYLDKKTEEQLKNLKKNKISYDNSTKTAGGGSKKYSYGTYYKYISVNPYFKAIRHTNDPMVFAHLVTQAFYEQRAQYTLLHRLYLQSAKRAYETLVEYEMDKEIDRDSSHKLSKLMGPIPYECV